MEQLIEDIKQDLIYKLESGFGLDIYAEDLHHELCNTDYFIIGRYQAKQWLSDNVFDAIQKIVDYESYMFGEQYFKDFSDPEKVANMIAYIYGEELLQRCDTLYEVITNSYRLNQKDIDNIISELKQFNSSLLIPYDKAI